MKFKLTALEKKWVLYDVANSAFTLLISTIMPIYFNYLADGAGLSSVDYLAYWGYATSLVTVLVAILGPTLGTMSDLQGRKKKFFLGSVLIGSVGCVVLGFMQSWIWFLVLFVLSKTAYSSSLVFYDAMLPDITQRERMDEVSSYGYAWGYIGSCIPFVACLLLVLSYESMGISMETAMALAFFLVAAWWLGGAVPLLRAYRQKHYVQARHAPVAESFRRLGNVFSELRRKPEILFFLLAFFFYIDGVYTVIDKATAYGTALGLDTTGLLLALLLTQVVAFPCSIFFGRLSRRMDARVILSICIGAYFGELDGFLDLSGVRGNVSGDHSGDFPVLLLKDHSGGAGRGVLRHLRYLRKGRRLYRDDPGLCGQPGDPQHQRGGGLANRDVPNRISFVPGCRREADPTKCITGPGKMPAGPRGALHRVAARLCFARSRFQPFRLGKMGSGGPLCAFSLSSCGMLGAAGRGRKKAGYLYRT